MIIFYQQKMSVGEISKEINSKRGIPARFFAWLIFFCIAFGSLPAFGQQHLKTSDLVFCPIQKIWVQKYAPQIVEKAPLDEVCASSRQKDRFFFEMSKKMPLLRLIHDSKQTEKIFFNYLERGKQALAEISSPENFPAPQFASLSATQKSTGGSYKTDFDNIQTKVFTLTRSPRPPNARKSARFETATAFRKLETISLRLQPRAPPISL